MLLTNMKEKNKKRILLPIILVAVGVVVAGVVLFLMNKDKTNSESTMFESDSPSEIAMNNDFTFEKLLSGENRGSFQCHYEFNEEEMAEMAEDSIAMTSYEGDYYFSDGLISMNVVQNGVEMHTLVLEDYTYTWSSNSDVGMRMPNTEEDDFEEYYSEEYEDFDDMDDANEQVAEFDRSKVICKKWNKDNSVFSIPDNISFNDMGSYMDASANMMDDYAEMAKEYEMMEVDMDMAE